MTDLGHHLIHISMFNDVCKFGMAQPESRKGLFERRRK